jgi:hypothetical protein
MKRLGLGILVLGVLALIEAILGLPRLFNDQLAIIYSRDVVVMVALLVLLAPTRWSRVWAWTCTLGFALVLFYEFVRAVGLTAMNQEPLLYDVFFLVQHLGTLLTDLMGVVGTAIPVGVVLAWFVLAWLVHRGFRWISRTVERWPWRSRGLLLCVIALGVAVAEHSSEIEPKDTLADLRENIGRSVDVYTGISEWVDDGAYKDIAAVQLRERPQVHIYIIESYGSGILASSIKDRYFALREAYEARLTDSGWHIATGRSDAPVMGGRSWLADATMLSGRLIKFESVYRHLTEHFSGLVTLPRFFRDQGYRTVLMRQNNKTRPGLELVNHFGFTDTVFFDDIAYTGEPYGWAEVPDQVALGHLRDFVLPGLGDAPLFVFAHLGTSHIPWDDLPPLVDDWRDLQGDGLVDVAEETAFTEAQHPLEQYTFKQYMYQLKRFKRQDMTRLRRLRATEENLGEYFDAIAYSFESVVRHIEALEDPPDLVIVTGDHQPPLYRKSTNFSVPMHVLARDRSHLDEFRKRGFKLGVRFGKEAHAIRHEAFFSVMVRALAKADGSEMPKYRAGGYVSEEDP